MMLSYGKDIHPTTWHPPATSMSSKSALDRITPKYKGREWTELLICIWKRLVVNFPTRQTGLRAVRRMCDRTETSVLPSHYFFSFRRERKKRLRSHNGWTGLWGKWSVRIDPFHSSYNTTELTIEGKILSLLSYFQSVCKESHHTSSWLKGTGVKAWK